MLPMTPESSNVGWHWQNLEVVKRDDTHPARNLIKPEMILEIPQCNLLNKLMEMCETFTAIEQEHEFTTYITE